MSDTLRRVQILASRGEVRISAHGYDELAADDIFVTDVIAGVPTAIVVEDYPNFGAARAFSCCKGMPSAAPFTSFGVSPRTVPARQWSSQRTGPIQHDGPMIF